MARIMSHFGICCLGGPRRALRLSGSRRVTQLVFWFIHVYLASFDRICSLESDSRTLVALSLTAAPNLFSSVVVRISVSSNRRNIHRTDLSTTNRIVERSRSCTFLPTIRQPALGKTHKANLFPELATDWYRRCTLSHYHLSVNWDSRESVAPWRRKSLPGKLLLTTRQAASLGTRQSSCLRFDSRPSRLPDSPRQLRSSEMCCLTSKPSLPFNGWIGMSIH